VSDQTGPAQVVIREVQTVQTEREATAADSADQKRDQDAPVRHTVPAGAGTDPDPATAEAHTPATSTTPH